MLCEEEDTLVHFSVWRVPSLGDSEAVSFLTIRPSMIPKLSLMTLARGARQFVVQEALLWSQRCSFSQQRCFKNEKCDTISIHLSLPDNSKGLVILLMVDAHDKHGGIGTGCRDDHSLGTTLQVSLRTGR